MLFHRKGFLLEADDGKSGGQTQSEGDPKTGGVDFAAWLDTQPDDVKAMYQAHTTGLQSALKAERDKSKGVADKLRRLEELEEIEAKRAGEKLTEKEKLEKQIADKEQAIAEANAKAEKAEERARQTRLSAEVRLQAQALGFADVSDVQKLADLSAVEITDDNVTGVEDALKVLAKAKPYLLKGEETTRKPSTPAPGGKSSKSKPTDNEQRQPLVRL